MTVNLSEGSRESLISGLFGAEAVTYLKNKHRGGVSGEKGTRYEDVFAVVQAAEQARSLGCECFLAMLEAQAALYFVDDLIVRVSSSGPPAESCFQLKNASGVSWGSGDKSLADDCLRQWSLFSAACHHAGRVVVVVSDPVCAQSLKDTVPPQLTTKVEVLWFPWAESTNVLCRLWPEELSALAWLSKHEDPDFQQVSDVLTVLLGVWVSCGGTVVVADLIRHARALSPSLIRSLVPDDEVWLAVRDEFKKALAEVENFSYSVVKGFFCWEYVCPNGSLQRGVFSHDCLSESFSRFQDRIVRQKPATFEELEEALL